MQIKLTVVVVVVGLQAHFLTFCFARLLFVSDFVALSRSKERILFASFFSPPLPRGPPFDSSSDHSEASRNRLEILRGQK